MDFLASEEQDCLQANPFIKEVRSQKPRPRPPIVIWHVGLIKLILKNSTLIYVQKPTSDP
jgi:hypothetical protein